MITIGASRRARTVSNTDGGDSVSIWTSGASAVGNFCHFGAPALTDAGSGVSGNTPMWPQTSNDVSSIEPMPAANRSTPSAAISCVKSPTHS